MTTFWIILNWIFSFVFAIIAIAIFNMGGKWQALFVVAIVLLLLPPFRSLIFNFTSWTIPWWGRSLLIVVLWAGFMMSIIFNPAKSIYKSPEIKAQFYKMYDEKLAQWSVMHESVFIKTNYGKVHVVVCGSEDAPPVLLIHASAIAAWSWYPNVSELAKHYRVYATDNIGEVNKSELADLKKPLMGKTDGGPEIARFYTELTSKLGFEESYVVGASIGGFLASNYAMYAPQRVKKLILLGPMGYGSTGKTILGITLAQSFPLKPVQDWAFKWAFGDAEHVKQEFFEWFYLILTGSMPKPTTPASFSPEQLQKMQPRTLAFFGTEMMWLAIAKMPKC
jgi:pimeloyl-ACP methyl ester carboxylesterase